MPAKRPHHRTPNRGRVAAVRGSSVRSPLEKFTSLSEEVEAWLLDTAPGVTPDTARTLITDMAIAVRLAQESAGLRHLGAWTAEHVTNVIATAAAVEEQLREDAGHDDVDPVVADLTQRVLGVLSPLVVFLVSTSRWTGSLDDLAAVRAVLDQVSPAAVQARALAEVLDRPDDPAAEASALAGLPLTQHLVALLRWVSPHRDVTGEGLLLPADLPGAAAAVGVSVDVDAPPATMKDVPRLLNLWVALEEAQLLDSSAARVAPAVAPDVLRSQTPLPREQLTVAVAEALQMTFDEACDANVPVDELSTSTVSALVVASLPLLATAATGGEVPAEALAAAHEMAGAGALFCELRDLGVLREGTEPGSVVVTPGLEKLLAAPVLELLEEVTAGDDDWDDDWEDGDGSDDVV